MNTSIIAIAVVSVLVLGGLAYYKWGAPGLGGVALGAFIVGVLFRRASSTPTPRFPLTPAWRPSSWLPRPRRERPPRSSRSPRPKRW
jgi:hypothetical protein